MGKTILIADDSLSMRQLVGFALKDAGYEVVEASNGSDALSKAESARADMVVTDLNMPGLDGIELIRKLRERAQYRFTPIYYADHRIPGVKEAGRQVCRGNRLDRQAVHT